MAKLHYSSSSRAILCRRNQRAFSLSRCNSSRLASRVNRTHLLLATCNPHSSKASRLELRQCLKYLSNISSKLRNNRRLLPLPLSKNPSLLASLRWQIASSRHHLRPQREDAEHQNRRAQKYQISGSRSSLRRIKRSLRHCSSLRLGTGRRCLGTNQEIC